MKTHCDNTLNPKYKHFFFFPPFGEMGTTRDRFFIRKMPKKFFSRPVTLRSTKDRLGLTLEKFEDDVFVARVAAGSAGRRAGFVVGNIVTHVDDKKVNSPEQLGT